MADYAPKVKKLLKEAGCYLERQGKGDHEIWYSPRSERRFPVKIRSRHLEAAAAKVAQIVDELRAREILPPPDHHDCHVEALKRQAAAAARGADPRDSSGRLSDTDYLI